VNSKDSYRQGVFTPRYPDKYLGDATNIVYRSSWELKAFEFLDGNQKVMYWASEELAIPYAKPVPLSENAQGWRKANYFPDLFVVYQLPDGTVRKEVIEIKPEKQTKPSKARKQTTRLQENYAYIVNQAKWEAALKWCTARGIVFSVLTEKSLFRM
jgi:hypothetical protein